MTFALLLGSTLAQYPAWVLGTIAGVLAGGVITDPGALGLDAIFPAFFLACSRSSCSALEPVWSARSRS